MKPSIHVVLMRGGTSKGVFIHAKDLPEAGPDRDELLLRVLGSPDPMQIDGLGGTYSSTSKVIVVEPGPDNKVTYWFAQIGIDQPIVDWSGNCGNLTTAVGPFAIDEGLVPVTGDRTTATLVNGNTGVEIHATVPTTTGRADTVGDLAIAGVPGTGAPVDTTYLNPSGGVLGQLLPFGEPTTVLETPNGMLSVSLVDAAHPNVFVSLEDLLPGAVITSETVSQLNGDPAFLDRIEAIRSSATVQIGRASNRREASTSLPAVPRIMLVGPSVDSAEADVRILAFSMGKVHRGLPMTGALCLAAARAIPGTIVSTLAGGTGTEIRVQHPLGVTQSFAQTRDVDGTVHVDSVGVRRTARRLMEGTVFPREY